MTPLKQKLTEEKLKLKELKSQLKMMYASLKKANEWSSEEIALAASGDKPKFKKKFKGTCYNCGKQGHKGPDCWEKEKNKDKRPKNYKRFQEFLTAIMEVETSRANVGNVEKLDIVRTTAPRKMRMRILPKNRNTF